MARPNGQWFRAMNELYVEQKLEQHPELIDKYKDNFGGFKQFCIKVMNYFGWQDIDAIQLEFDSENFYGLKLTRMYEMNVKKWKRISKQVFERDSYTCHYCGKAGGILEVDHIIAFSKGGADDLENLVTACRKCNRQKRNKSVEEFYTWRQQNEQLFFT